MSDRNRMYQMFSGLGLLFIFSGPVIADDADNTAASAQIANVRKDIGCAAQVRRFALNVYHGHRRFRRDASDIAPDKFIEHDIAQHDDAAVARCLQNLLGPIFI